MMEGKLVKPIKFLCRHDAESYKIINPKTENRYRFYRGQPYLVKIKEDIEFLDSHDLFLRVFDEVNEKEIKKQVKRDLKEEAKEAESEDVEGEEVLESEDIVEETAGEDSESEPEEKVDKYSKAQLRKMNKSEVRAILKLLSDKDCPVRKNNIINLILEVQ